MSQKSKFVAARESLLESLDLAPEATEFIEGCYTSSETSREQARIISEFYLAETLRELARANDKHTRQMKFLTVALALFAAVEAFATAVQAGLVELSLGP